MKHRAHQCPSAEQQDIVPGHVPIFLGGFPIARRKAGGVVSQRYFWLRELRPDGMNGQSDAALDPGQTWIGNQIDEAGDWRSRHAALAPVQALSCSAQSGILV